MTAGGNILKRGILYLLVGFTLACQSALVLSRPQPETAVPALTKSRAMNASPETSDIAVTKKCSNSIEKVESERCAEWTSAMAAQDSANWAFWSLFVGAISSIGVLAALWLAFRANRISQNTANQQLRAYITFAAFELIPQAGLSHKVQASWRNTGQTPAKEVVSYIRWDEFPKGLPDDFTFEPGGTKINGAACNVGPNQESFCHDSITIDPEKLASVADGKTQIFIWGRAMYKDIFNATHRSEYASELKVERVGDQFGIHPLPLAKHNSIT